MNTLRPLDGVATRTSKISFAFLLLIALTSPSASSAIEKVRIAYPYLSSSVFYLAIAQHEGYYTEEGLSAELVSIRGDIAIKAALTGDVDVFTTAAGAVVAGIRGLPVKVIAV